MKFYYIALFVLLPFSSLANENVSEYYKLINSAELEIAAENPKGALGYYQEAFLKLPAFSTDIYNATVCALETSQHELALQYCKLLAQKGVGAAYFEKKAMFQVLRSQDEWKALLKNAQHIQDSIIIKTQIYRALFDSVQVADQRNASENRKWSGAKNIPNDTFERATTVQDSLCSLLLDLFEKNGFIGENQMGVTMYNDTSFSSHYAYDISFVHAFQLGSIGNRIRILSLVKESIDKGLVDHRRLNYIAAFPGFFGYPWSINCSRMFKIFECKLYNPSIPQAILARHEKLRKDFYFSSYKDLLTKSFYKLNPKGSPYYIGISLKKGTEFEKKQFVTEMKSYSETDVLIPNCQ
jgi:hypothetical protein